ncbi:MAG: DUF523 domain-containing protein [Actinobacteria bacterium]|nr:DUF523 domain-containing protein [Actinomycetota bacterium]
MGNASWKTIKLGISACLLGEEVRYDGGHKRDDFLMETLGSQLEKQGFLVEWVPVCPEVEAGLGVPREPMQLMVAAEEPPLTGTPGSPRLVTAQTGIDHTGQMLDWIRRRLPELARENLRGFIFKSRSPSCGMQVGVQSTQGAQDRLGPGIWAGAFIAANPTLPAVSEDRLREPGIREDFIERILSPDR